MSKIKLSFTTLNNVINAPHTYINKVTGLHTFSTDYFEQGKAAHRIVQDHVSGVKDNDFLGNLPKFSLVEEVDFDEKMRIEYDISDKYYLVGYVDGIDPERKEMLEIKSGRVWSPGEFARTPQWKLYALGLPDYKKIWLVNIPKDENLWMPETIRVYNADITDKHKEEALEFIHKGISVIENIREKIDEEMEIKKSKGYTGRSRFCFYEGCNFCE